MGIALDLDSHGQLHSFSVNIGGFGPHVDPDMQILADKSRSDILRSLLAEVAKSQNELKCARQDIEKAQGRLTFALACIHELMDRPETHR